MLRQPVLLHEDGLQWPELEALDVSELALLEVFPGMLASLSDLMGQVWKA